ncbi:Glycosyltransferase involved in cell wall bisynthesis [Desulfonauticus submarinus]|uniref:Glycosyltransferase involved in cell wall bisynthesis n=1 Tax=Desulfonauticus submarinus TaxID=206665 RepID=A0A1H0D3T8_9BACT|nr:glycosyltransferase [Desulfonauticus submarinus]SDN64834.1 Glycosyltransferase involved in cell wall bisynthesis [Desulfonauticus submarinus]
MQIAFVNSTHKWGGVKTWTLDVALALKKYAKTNCIILGRKGPFLDKAQELSLRTYEIKFGPDYNPITIAKFITIFKKENIHYVIVNVGKDMRTAGVAAKILNIPVIHRVGLPGDMKNKIDVRLMHKWIKPKILVPCEYIKQGLLKNLPFLQSNEIKVILTGKEPSPTPPQKVHTPLQFISTSQLNPDKGHKDILFALCKLKQQGYDFHYHIVGTGKSEQELKQLASQLQLNDKITWHGFQKNVRNLLKKADVFILASYSEGLPNSLLEAMAEGLIPVARNVGGVKEISPSHTFLWEEENLFLSILEDLLNTQEYKLLKLKKEIWSFFQKKFNLLQKSLELNDILYKINSKK